MKLSFKIALLFSACLLLTGTAWAQEKEKPATERKRLNAIKTNLFSPFSIGYERGFGDHFSLSAFFSYLPKLSVGDTENEVGKLSLEKPAAGYAFEARYYVFNKYKQHISDFYMGGYHLYRLEEFSGHKIFSTTSSTETTTFDILLKIPSKLTATGIMIGWQRTPKKGFLVDFNMGLGYYKFANIPDFDVPEGSSLRFEKLEKFTKISSGIGPRLSFSLGYMF
ncbi:MAG TPA: DUF3575 domain-containing protein [Bacteroidetes bacterium]|nr:DUF3575 domain-containing protein [Bacteroidota bacterium]